MKKEIERTIKELDKQRTIRKLLADSCTVRKISVKKEIERTIKGLDKQTKHKYIFLLIYQT